MHRLRHEAGSRGSSILSGILTLAILGGTTLVVEPIVHVRSQLAQIPQAIEKVEEEGSKEPECDEKEKCQIADVASVTIKCGAITRTINYACFLQGEGTEVKKFSGSCKGFSVKVKISDNSYSITPTPLPGGALLDGCTVPSRPVCPNGTLALQSTNNEACELPDELFSVSDSRSGSSPAFDPKGLAEELSQKNYPERLEFLEQLSVDDTVKQTVLTNLEQQEMLETEIRRVESELALQPEASESLNRQLTTLRADLQALKDNQVRLLADTLPSSAPPPPFTGNQVSFGDTFRGSESTFEAPKTGQEEQESQSWWSKMRDGMSSWLNPTKNETMITSVAKTSDLISDEIALQFIAAERDRAQAFYDTQVKTYQDGLRENAMIEEDAARMGLRPNLKYGPENLAAMQYKIDIAKEQLDKTQANYNACASGNCPESLQVAKEQAAKGEGETSGFLRSINDVIGAERERREDRIFETVNPLEDPLGYLYKSLIQNPIDAAYWVSGGMIQTAIGGTRTVAQESLPTEVGNFLGIRGAPEEVIANAANPDRARGEAVQAGAGLVALGAPFVGPVYRVGEGIITRTVTGTGMVDDATAVASRVFEKPTPIFSRNSSITNTGGGLSGPSLGNTSAPIGKITAKGDYVQSNNLSFPLNWATARLSPTSPNTQIGGSASQQTVTRLITKTQEVPETYVPPAARPSFVETPRAANDNLRLGPRLVVDNTKGITPQAAPSVFTEGVQTGISLRETPLAGSVFSPSRISPSLSIIKPANPSAFTGSPEAQPSSRFFDTIVGRTETPGSLPPAPLSIFSPRPEVTVGSLPARVPANPSAFTGSPEAQPSTAPGARVSTVLPRSVTNPNPTTGLFGNLFRKKTEQTGETQLELPLKGGGPSGGGTRGPGGGDGSSVGPPASPNAAQPWYSRVYAIWRKIPLRKTVITVGGAWWGISSLFDGSDSARIPGEPIRISSPGPLSASSPESPESEEASAESPPSEPPDNTVTTNENENEEIGRSLFPMFEKNASPQPETRETTPLPTRSVNTGGQYQQYPSLQQGFTQPTANFWQLLGQKVASWLLNRESEEKEQDTKNEEQKKKEEEEKKTITTSKTTSVPIPSLKPAVTLIANPSVVSAGKTSKISWASVFTNSCTVTYPDGTILIEDGLSQDTVVTSPLSITTMFTVTCTTDIEPISASTTVTVQ